MLTEYSICFRLSTTVPVVSGISTLYCVNLNLIAIPELLSGLSTIYTDTKLLSSCLTAQSLHTPPTYGIAGVNDF